MPQKLPMFVCSPVFVARRKLRPSQHDQGSLMLSEADETRHAAEGASVTIKSACRENCMRR